MGQAKAERIRLRKAQQRAKRFSRGGEGGDGKNCQPGKRGPSQCRDQRAGRELLRALDPQTGVRDWLTRVAGLRSEWAGIPLPLDGERLVVEPNYPYAGISEIGAKSSPADLEFEGAKIVNQFWSWRWRSDVVIWEKDGKRHHGIVPGVHHLDFDMHTLGCADAWSLETEETALKTLGTLLSHRQFKQYILTGMFLETSKRSRVTYLFRRLKPTVALGRTATGELKILCVLCLHPIAYYAGTWAGAMCPSDDVTAHLMLMRGDEKLFWRRANQHAAFRPEAGL